MGPLDRDREAELLGGGHHVARVALAHGERRRHGEHQRLATRLDRTGALERLEVRLKAAIENRRLGARQLDRQIVNLVRRDRSQQVLHGVDRVGTLADRSATLDPLDFRQ
jgi:hypothetical protein